MQTDSKNFLRRVLAVDAIASAAMALVLVGAAATLAPLLSMPADLLRESGWVLLPFAAFVGWLASRSQPWRAGVWCVIVMNALWAIDSLLLLFSGWIEPNILGYGFVIAQALVVAVLAELEFLGLRRGAAARVA